MLDLSIDYSNVSSFRCLNQRLCDFKDHVNQHHRRICAIQDYKSEHVTLLQMAIGAPAPHLVEFYRGSSSRNLHFRVWQKKLKKLKSNNSIIAFAPSQD